MAKLHIGGKQRAEGWEILDALPGPHVDHVGNARDLSRFPDSHFEAVYASHVLEHFDYQGELLQTLREWGRVLKPEGSLYVSVPDLTILCELFLNSQQLNGKDRFMVMRMMFGGHINEYDYHLVGLNVEFLASYLSQAGFVNARRVRSFQLFSDTSEMVFKTVPISLNVIAQKPAAAATQPNS
jgi:predicted SAM-dependent methyltransferase